MGRREGHYWAYSIAENMWIVAYFRGGAWYVWNDDFAVSEEDFSEIREDRLTPPDEQD